jgi:hypothetical protein
MISVMAIGVRRVDGPGGSIWFWECALKTKNTKVKAELASGTKDGVNFALIFDLAREYQIPAKLATPLDFNREPL